VPREPVGQEAFAVVRDAMGEQGMIALGHVILSSRQRPIAIEAYGKGLRGFLLRHLHEVRSEAEYFSDIPEMKLPREMLQLAKHIALKRSLAAEGRSIVKPAQGARRPVDAEASNAAQAQQRVMGDWIQIGRPRRGSAHEESP
jgi:hypothetical protein